MPYEPGLPRRHDEHMTLPTYRVRQLQDIEDAATEAVELINTQEQDKRRSFAVLAEVRALLTEALDART
jgi:hypothetical protein